MRWTMGVALSGVLLMACGEGSSGDDGGLTFGSGMPTTSTSAPTTATTAGADAGDGLTGGPATGGGSTDGSETDDGAGTTAGGPTVAIAGVVRRLVTDDPFAMVEVCAHDGPQIPCAQTHATGAYVLSGVPAGVSGALEFSGGGVFPGLFWGVTPLVDGTVNYATLDNIEAIFFAAQLGETINPSLGHIGIGAVDGGGSSVEGATFFLSPDSGVGGYLDDEGLPDPALSTTSSTGFAGWTNVAPGSVEIRAFHPALDCAPGPQAIAGATPGTIRVEVEAGFISSSFSFVCE